MSDHPRRGLEQALARAATDPEFRRRLLADRSRAAQQMAFALGDSERAILDSVPAAQLEAMIAELPAVPAEPPPVAFAPSMGIRPDEVGIVRGHTGRVAVIALGAAVTVGAVGVGMCVVSHGHTSEVPPPRLEERAPSAPQGRPDAGTIDRGDKSADPKR